MVGTLDKVDLMVGTLDKVDLMVGTLDKVDLNRYLSPHFFSRLNPMGKRYSITVFYIYLRNFVRNKDEFYSTALILYTCQILLSTIAQNFSKYEIMDFCNHFRATKIETYDFMEKRINQLC